ncbi:right-handed parallel beta-helix repeat-containing protein [Bifidobacterium sp. ESL0764]|uniref:right-handed parallel beta-helix repeat-containing protein n=1 Tax=Bifidobacterium sp. ESL0764 TaxID=2983228 RepID=UPI0023F964A4|nr:right-handed parallel beta-helix repeat-containing protein [Bifidobacterium sp. ESL0764]WEV65346.1 right-handed parallel beta-helix repeat-containing protein [Bifidobacterium sp. ESL0764]
MVSAATHPTTLHVSADAGSPADGSELHPFARIQEAADIALPGDTVLVHGGMYRERVNPRNAGTSTARITYEVAKGEHAVISGAEKASNWQADGEGIWHIEVPNTLFGDFNPYAQPLEGDWLVSPDPDDWQLSLGDVYINGKSMYQARTYEDMAKAERRAYGPGPDWVKIDLPIPHADDTVYQWYAQVNADTTTIWGNFHQLDPNKESTEFNVRKECFYPDKTGIGYITVRGFELCQAACPWAPPTADQPGLIGPHWSKGWIIEDNDIHDAKCSAVSLGKEASTGENESYLGGLKPGYQCQLEGVFRGRHIGWDKETVGSHIVRNNVIHDCGQNGVVGNMGGAFSTIEHNKIYNIGIKYEYFGHEIAGIKLHAGIDVRLINNDIHDCILGTWLDWQAQGTRVTRNVYHDNVRDFMIEVTHGPCLFDNNIFASDYNFDNAAQGSAFVHNIFCGSTRKITVPDRFTPYHLPHSTKLLGTACVYGNDDRFYQNVFAGSAVLPGTDTRGTEIYDGAPASTQEFIERVHAMGGGDVDIFEQVPQPAYIDGNAYYNGTKHYNREEHCYSSSEAIDIAIEEKDDGSVWCSLSVPETPNVRTSIVDTQLLGTPRITGEAYENPDGSPLKIDTDIAGNPRGEHPVPGPFANLDTAKTGIRVF